MPDMDVIVKSLRRCFDMIICPDDCYYRKYAPDCIEKLHKDAIALMKDQNELLKQQAELLEEQEDAYSKLSKEYLSLANRAAHKPNIVRCKDCKHGRANDIGQIQCNMTIGDDDIHEQDWFCAYGKRKEGERE